VHKTDICDVYVISTLFLIPITNFSRLIIGVKSNKQVSDVGYLGEF